MSKLKLSIPQQIEYLKNKGITFTKVDENSAINFLTYNSYFFKLKSYSKNYEKKPNGKYINLDFVYLQELSTLDMHFRRFTLRLTLDLEHMLKTKILRDFNQNTRCDGYIIVNEFLAKYPKLKEHLESFNFTGYTAKDNILKKYNLNLAIWNFIEIIEFGHFINFCEFYYDKYSDSIYNEIKGLLWSIKCLRNSSAHNNCLLHKLRPLEHKYFKRNIKITQLLKENIIMSQKTIERKMQIPTIHDFIISLLAYKQISSSQKMGRAFNKDLHNLINIRFRKNEKYFEKNPLIISNYTFLRKVIIFLKKS
ncbi:hypothetical protein CRV08_15390 [Halarcobacter ebronensis]|uniref:CAAX protease n=1 Tax=Halarcobacter ebronensis TaxID=1462615 RepID=A0A4Q0Y671_9BACT|nr:Abi family protein [Halarcobacter ebronensis]RXJ65373.1 hypothetical protein CRV08_15390 [Halarcobacter ebronensis]